VLENFPQLNGYTATRFLREFITNNWTRAQILIVQKRTVVQTYSSAK